LKSILIRRKPQTKPPKKNIRNLHLLRRDLPPFLFSCLVVSEKKKKEDEEADLISCKFPKTQEKKCDGEAATPINKKLNCFSYYPTQY
jgi:hypothetical protein